MILQCNAEPAQAIKITVKRKDLFKTWDLYPTRLVISTATKNDAEDRPKWNVSDLDNAK